MNKLILGTPLLLVLAACGGSVEIAASAGGTGGSGSTGTGGGPASTSGAGGSGGMEFSCDLSMGQLATSIMAYNGPPPACAMMGPQGPPVIWTGTGAVTKSDAGTLVIDQCSPVANCMPLLTTVTVKGDALALSVPIGAYVKVSYALDPAWGFCTERMLIENVPAWDGVPNPVSASNRIYLTGAEGEIGTFDSVPFVVAQQALGCSTEKGCGGIPPDTYVLFTAGTQIGMGQTRTITAKGRSFAFHNLRSYQTSACDDYWNWAFWAVEE